MKAANRMIINTIIMYLRYIIMIFITLFSSRWILLALGEEDFGIYNVVAGIVAMLMFLNITMASSTQRYLSYAQGTHDENLIKDTFYFSQLIHLIVAFLLLICFETAGMYAIDHILNVPVGKEYYARFVLHCMTFSTFVTVVSVPYMATLLSHENILYCSVVQIFDSLCKFSLAYYLLYYNGNRLQLYSVSIMLVTILIQLCFVVFCKLKYKETRMEYKIPRDFSLCLNILKYSSWNLIGGISSMLRFQGLSILLNTFYGVIVNAAYGIANQVNGQLQFFSNAIVTAAKPQIVKSEGMGNRRRMHRLSFTTCKITFLLLSIIAIPLMIDMPFILEKWLNDIPNYTIEFTRLMVCFSLISQLSIGISIGVESVGDIKYLQLVVGGLHFFVLPIAYILLKYGVEPKYAFYVLILEEAFGAILRILISRKITGLVATIFVKEVIIPCMSVLLVVFVLCFWLDGKVSDNSFVNVICISALSLFFISLLSYFFVLNDIEKAKINQMLNDIISKNIK